MRPYEQPHIRQKLQYIIECVLRVVPDTERIILFGSYAYGVPHEDSDLDIYVVVPDSVPEREIDLMITMYLEMDKDYDRLMFPMDLIVSKSKRFHKRIHEPTIAKTVADEGVVIYDTEAPFVV